MSREPVLVPPGGRWNSIPHEPIEGLLERRLCQTARCEVFQPFPGPAEWLELVWMPRAPISEARVWSAWFTCADCHAGMLETGGLP